MPVYEYICKHCGHGFDRIVPHERADTPGACPSCENDDVRRRFSRIAVRYGSWGFSSTDGMVPDRPGRGDFRAVQERAERISEGDTGSPMHD